MTSGSISNLASSVFRRSRLVLSAVSFGVFSVVFASGCTEQSSKSNSSSEAQGSRVYKLDPEAASVRVSVFGVAMGTPDAEKILLLLKSLEAAGEFSSLVVESEGIEGGFSACSSFSATAKRGAIYDLLRSIETDSKETNFSAVSASSCSHQNP